MDFAKHLSGYTMKIILGDYETEILLTTYLPILFTAMHKMPFFPNICELNLISNNLLYEAQITSFPHMSYRLKPRTVKSTFQFRVIFSHHFSVHNSLLNDNVIL